MGPIRVRALRKAGFDSLCSLQAADLAALCAVPGMSEIKARQLHDFLAGFPASALEQPEPPPGESAETEPRPATQAADSALLLAAIRALGAVTALLPAASDSGLRPRLCRELARFSDRVQALAGSAADLTAKETERAVRRLNRIGALLAEARRDIEDRKAQARLAAALGEEIDRLAAPAPAGPAGRARKEEPSDA
jgi:hypothetical protein